MGLKQTTQSGIRRQYELPEDCDTSYANLAALVEELNADGVPATLFVRPHNRSETGSPKTIGVHAYLKVAYGELLLDHDRLRDVDILIWTGWQDEATVD